MANTHEVGVVIHVDELLSEEQRAALIGNVQKHDGVERARFTKGREHLMVIEYDSSKLHSSDVLAYVRREHVNAELIII